MDQHAEVVGFLATVALYPLRLLHCPRITQTIYLPNAFKTIRQLLQVKCNRGGMITSPRHHADGPDDRFTRPAPALPTPFDARGQRQDCPM